MYPGQRLIHTVEDAVSRCSVQAHIHVNPVFFPKADGPVDGEDLFLADLEKVVGVGPEAIIHGQAYPVEAPVANPTEVILEKHPVILIGEVLHPVRVDGEVLEQVKAVPLGIFRHSGGARA